MILFDTNVLLDIATADPIWLPWSEKEFRAAAAQGSIPINPIIYAELPRPSRPSPILIGGSIQLFFKDCRCLTPPGGSQRRRS